ncbi:predicted protein [Lichtheimia corymbifera JMRC:FSU:9682]|uniref:Uncharacterized protein n=1 Tax=Lichtheimia corymbifera JMRC:FSU:9682 TaxID=1263082 RepID=A0A068SD57_9FUNG|nr:predicted protein [Lichtheimia corymbifera JMRC:FSU:9682]
MKRGVFNRTKLRGGVKRTLCRSFTIVVAILGFTQCHHQPRRKKKFKRSTPDLFWLVVTLRNLGSSSLIVKLAPKVRFTPTSKFVRLKTPPFIVKFRDTGTCVFYVCCKRDPICKVILVHCQAAGPR